MLTKNGAYKVEIPRELYMAIVKIQAEKDLDWYDACIEASRLVTTNREEVEKLAEKKARELYNSKFMSQLNKARRKVWEDGYEKGYGDGYRVEHFTVPCCVCGGPTLITSENREQWEKEVKPILYKAFSNWGHKECIEKQS